MEAVIKMTVPAVRHHVRWRQIADGVLLAGVLATLYIYARVQGSTWEALEMDMKFRMGECPFPRRNFRIRR